MKIYNNTLIMSYILEIKNKNRTIGLLNLESNQPDVNQFSKDEFARYPKATHFDLTSLEGSTPA